jgi:hypothetical protein
LCPLDRTPTPAGTAALSTFGGATLTELPAAIAIAGRSRTVKGTLQRVGGRTSGTGSCDQAKHPPAASQPHSASA